MARLVAFVCLLLVASTYAALDSSFPAFLEYVQDYGKSYETMEEFQLAFATFQDNVKLIEGYRQQHYEATGEPGEFVFGLTKFSDLSPAEFKARYLNYKPNRQLSQIHKVASVMDSQPDDNVTKWDWRDYHAVTPVKDQEQCGSCWAFSATEEIESAWFLAHNNTAIPVLSPQQIVSCDTVDQGCNGGDTTTAYAYVKKAGGLEADKTYPYTSGNGDNGVCKFKASEVVAKISGFTYAVPPCTDACDHQDEDKLAASLLTAPISICVDAEPWQFYTGGILSSGCPKDYSELDHCVQLVGYNFEGATPYWLIRNSWNTDWGEEGYIYVKKGENLCGVADEATIVTI